MGDQLHDTISGINADTSGLQDGYTLVYDQALGKFKVAKGGAGGGATDKWPSKEIRDNYQIIGKDFGYTFVITGCDNTSSEVIITLPSVTTNDIGAWFKFVKLSSETKITILCSSGQQIMDSQISGSLYNSTSELGSNVEIQLISSAYWSIVSGLGTWSTN